MGARFGDITLYSPHSGEVRSPEYVEERSLHNFVSDLYVQHMNGYKPPGTTRITIQPDYYKLWNRTWKNGSIVSIASYFSLETFKGLDRKGRLLYSLDLIQESVLALSDEYGWDKDVFINAYQKVLHNDFMFSIASVPKQSRDRKKIGKSIIEKTDGITSMFVNIEMEDISTTIKLFDKPNAWHYDCVYFLQRHSKWFDNERFGITINKGEVEMWCSINSDTPVIMESNKQVVQVDFGKYFSLNRSF